VLKVSLGDLTTKEQMIGALRALRAEATAALADGRDIARSMLAEGGSEEGRAHVVAVMYEFVFSHFEMMGRWAEWAEREVESWPSTGRSDDMERTLEVFRRALQRSDWVEVPSSEGLG
jgi:hypothetical protein